MTHSQAASVEAYLNELTPERREVVARVRKMILEHLPDGYIESMNWGMISYEIPLDVYPDTYNKKPLGYLALAAQKNHYALYMLGVYADPAQEKELREGFRKTGKKMDMGKSCIRFRKLEDLPLDVIASLIAGTSPEKMIERYKQARNK
ncbi:MAG: DUF1801 domain-containing protein [Anaerolineales bacterium]|nr:DUF1801 domain-containing protein [Anaerolineales bacterium]